MLWGGLRVALLSSHCNEVTQLDHFCGRHFSVSFTIIFYFPNFLHLFVIQSLFIQNSCFLYTCLLSYFRHLFLSLVYTSWPLNLSIFSILMQAVFCRLDAAKRQNKLHKPSMTLGLLSSCFHCDWLWRVAPQGVGGVAGSCPLCQTVLSSWVLSVCLVIITTKISISPSFSQLLS